MAESLDDMTDEELAKDHLRDRIEMVLRVVEPELGPGTLDSGDEPWKLEFEDSHPFDIHFVESARRKDYDQIDFVSYGDIPEPDRAGFFVDVGHPQFESQYCAEYICKWVALEWNNADDDVWMINQNVADWIRAEEDAGRSGENYPQEHERLTNQKLDVIGKLAKSVALSEGVMDGRRRKSPAVRAAFDRGVELVNRGLDWEEISTVEREDGTFDAVEVGGTEHVPAGHVHGSFATSEEVGAFKMAIERTYFKNLAASKGMSAQTMTLAEGESRHDPELALATRIANRAISDGKLPKGTRVYRMPDGERLEMIVDRGEYRRSAFFKSPDDLHGLIDDMEHRGALAEGAGDDECVVCGYYGPHGEYVAGGYHCEVCAKGKASADGLKGPLGEGVLNEGAGTPDPAAGPAEAYIAGWIAGVLLDMDFMRYRNTQPPAVDANSVHAWRLGLNHGKESWAGLDAAQKAGMEAAKHGLPAEACPFTGNYRIPRLGDHLHSRFEIDWKNGHKKGLAARTRDNLSGDNPDRGAPLFGEALSEGLTPSSDRDANQTKLENEVRSWFEGLGDGIDVRAEHSRTAAPGALDGEEAYRMKATVSVSRESSFWNDRSPRGELDPQILVDEFESFMDEGDMRDQWYEIDAVAPPHRHDGETTVLDVNIYYTPRDNRLFSESRALAESGFAKGKFATREDRRKGRFLEFICSMDYDTDEIGDVVERTLDCLENEVSWKVGKIVTDTPTDAVAGGGGYKENTARILTDKLVKWGDDCTGTNYDNLVHLIDLLPDEFFKAADDFIPEELFEGRRGALAESNLALTPDAKEQLAGLRMMAHDQADADGLDSDESEKFATRMERCFMMGYDGREMDKGSDLHSPEAVSWKYGADERRRALAEARRGPLMEDSDGGAAEERERFLRFLVDETVNGHAEDKSDVEAVVRMALEFMHSNGHAECMEDIHNIIMLRPAPEVSDPADFPVEALIKATTDSFWRWDSPEDDRFNDHDAIVRLMDSLPDFLFTVMNDSLPEDLF